MAIIDLMTNTESPPTADDGLTRDRIALDSVSPGWFGAHRQPLPPVRARVTAGKARLARDGSGVIHWAVLGVKPGNARGYPCLQGWRPCLLEAGVSQRR